MQRDELEAKVDELNPQINQLLQRLLEQGIDLMALLLSNRIYFHSAHLAWDDNFNDASTLASESGPPTFVSNGRIDFQSENR